MPKIETQCSFLSRQQGLYLGKHSSFGAPINSTVNRRMIVVEEEGEVECEVTHKLQVIHSAV